MSEHSPKAHERHEAHPHPEHHKRQHEAHKHTAEKAKHARHEHAERLDQIRKETEATAKSSRETAQHHHEDTPAEQENQLPINRELKNMAYQRTLKRTQRQLSAPSRAFSKVVHHPAVEATSEIASKTIARPSGILAGSIAAFIGSSIFLWIARHYGYEYNYFLLALLFVGGFFIGLLVELGLFAAARKQR